MKREEVVEWNRRLMEFLSEALGDAARQNPDTSIQNFDITDNTWGGFDLQVGIRFHGRPKFLDALKRKMSGQAMIEEQKKIGSDLDRPPSLDLGPPRGKRGALPLR